jgi:transposase
MVLSTDQMRFGCAVFGVAHKLVAEVLKNFKDAHRHAAMTALKNPISVLEVAKQLECSERFVKKWWNSDLKSNFQVDRKGKSGRKRRLSAPVMRVVHSKTRKRFESTRKIRKTLQVARGVNVHHTTIWRALKREKFKRVQAPAISQANIENRLEFCEYLNDWEESDCLHLAPSDEFFLYSLIVVSSI